MTRYTANKTADRAPSEPNAAETLHPTGMDGGWVSDVRRWVENNNRREQSLAHLEDGASPTRRPDAGEDDTPPLPGERSAHSQAAARNRSDRGAA